MMDHRPLLVRQSGTCPANQAYYVCNAGNFRGCCSTDPCSSGICPDETSSITSSTSLTLLNTGPTASATTSSSTSAVSLATSTSTTTGSASQTPSATSSNAAASPTHARGHSISEGARLGGIIGGVIAGLLALMIFFCLCCRRRRTSKRGDSGISTLIRWHQSNRVEDDEKGQVQLVDTDTRVDDFKGQLHDHTPHPKCSDQSSTLHSNTTGPLSLRFSSPSKSTATGTRVKSAGATTFNSYVSTPRSANTSTTPNSATLGTRESITTCGSEKQRYTLLNPESRCPSAELPASVPLRAGVTPELDDTGFYLQRAELATYSQSELINVPLEQRTSQPLHEHELTPGVVATKASSNMAGGNETQTATKSVVVTPDGILVGSKLDQLRQPGAVRNGVTHDRNPGRQQRNGHVMSFMHYDPAQSPTNCQNDKTETDIATEMPDSVRDPEKRTVGLGLSGTQMA